MSESEEERRAAEARVQKIHKLQGISPFNHPRSPLSTCESVSLTPVIPCLREPAESGPADLLRPGGEAADLR